MGLDLMTISAQKLDIISLAKSNLAVELHTIHSHSLNVPAAVDVVDVKDAVVADAALFAATTERFVCAGFPFALSAPSTFSAEFAEAICVVLSPLLVVGAVFRTASRLAVRIVAFLTGAAMSSTCHVEIGQRFRFGTGCADSRCIHIVKPTSKRIPMTMDQIMPGYH